MLSELLHQSTIESCANAIDPIDNNNDNEDNSDSNLNFNEIEAESPLRTSVLRCAQRALHSPLTKHASKHNSKHNSKQNKHNKHSKHHHHHHHAHHSSIGCESVGTTIRSTFSENDESDASNALMPSPHSPTSLPSLPSTLYTSASTFESSTTFESETFESARSSSSSSSSSSSLVSEASNDETSMTNTKTETETETKTVGHTQPLSTPRPASPLAIHDSFNSSTSFQSLQSFISIDDDDDHDDHDDHQSNEQHIADESDDSKLKEPINQTKQVEIVAPVLSSRMINKISGFFGQKFVIQEENGEQMFSRSTQSLLHREKLFSLFSNPHASDSSDSSFMGKAVKMLHSSKMSANSSILYSYSIFRGSKTNLNDWAVFAVADFSAELSESAPASQKRLIVVILPDGTEKYNAEGGSCGQAFSYGKGKSTDTFSLGKVPLMTIESEMKRLAKDKEFTLSDLIETESSNKSKSKSTTIVEDDCVFRRRVEEGNGIKSFVGSFSDLNSSFSVGDSNGRTLFSFDQEKSLFQFGNELSPAAATAGDNSLPNWNKDFSWSKENKVLPLESPTENEEFKSEKDPTKDLIPFPSSTRLRNTQSSSTMVVLLDLDLFELSVSIRSDKVNSLSFASLFISDSMVINGTFPSENVSVDLPFP
eukprot:TRINITY_DN6615_c0_g1_i1.p1 TRINITY_DN6615_c0_g1~~TRINITY_DN6615_c0_g1_i1.p1  ORF type:complete len:700 (+),score=237.90 TRINITY_DN6615_c0_g1_i1:148-2100(+)